MQPRAWTDIGYISLDDAFSVSCAVRDNIWSLNIILLTAN